MPKAILLISCPDQKGITATVTNFVYHNRGNILHADQHIDDQNNTFFMRVEWSLDGFQKKRQDIKTAFGPVARKFRMKWNLYFSDEPVRMAVFVSKHLHCLYDLLYRHQAGQIRCEIPLIISNHPDARGIAKNYNINFCEVPIQKSSKSKQEQRELKILRTMRIDVVALARYHQILSPQFVRSYKNRIINIHHSFLPAFAGKSPYAQAYSKGVKIIGATSHYVTEKLDDGPIIEQDTVRVSHRDTLSDLVRKGEDLERIVFYRAIRWHLERKILIYNNKTVIFE